MKEVRLAGLACTGVGGVDAALAQATALIEDACTANVDLICLPEIFAWTGLDPEDRPAQAQTTDGPFCRQLAELAARYRVNILTALAERAGAHMFNTMVWLDRTGSVLGTYRKVFTTVYEIDQGFSPGALDFDVFQTEFGPIGCCICFDINFPEVAARLAAQKPRLVVFPSMFDGLALMQARAKLLGSFIMSVAGDPYGALVDPMGKLLVEPWRHGAILFATVNLDFAVLHTDENRDKFTAVRRLYGDGVYIDNRYLESCAVLYSRHPDKSALDMVRECELELESEYYDRSREKCRHHRSR